MSHLNSKIMFRQRIALAGGDSAHKPCDCVFIGLFHFMLAYEAMIATLELGYGHAVDSKCEVV